ncbi:TetR/AcrR family transcriptional regulator [Spongisporangium articulatum]|uniref:TetR/AcrR family transcriptional regulator n=1 Tax=Spongisporangium articulatum TaxID=3362603 RepID=A0ABW8AGP6_9ACTN
MAEPILRRPMPDGDLPERLIDAAATELRESGYQGLTVRLVARRAGVSPATAYKVFSSKEHLVASILLRHVKTLPDPPEGTTGQVGERLAALLQSFADAIGAEPELRGALQATILGNDPDSTRVRQTMVEDFMQRFAVVVGDELSEEQAMTVLLAFAGTMIMAGAGMMPFDQIGEQVRSIVRTVQ